MKPAIQVENLSKQYRLGAHVSSNYRTVRETLTNSFAGAWKGLRSRLNGSNSGNGACSARENAIWAVKDIAFEVQPGEVVGIIGRNGAGKSTLLKILSRITEPTDGRIEVRGRMGSLLEVGTGFHPELTGRENIYLNGIILGMKREEVKRKFDEIVAFSEIEEFLDTPVKRYSSGMYVRLAFAVAAHLEPDILVIDEVLAVGDVAFQRKCMGRLKQVGQGGRTVLFVSHNMAAVRNLCQKSLVLDHGRLIFQGPTEDAVRMYVTAETEANVSDLDLSSHPGRPATCTRVFKRLRLLNSEGESTNQVLCGEPLLLEFTLLPITHHNLQVIVNFEDTYTDRLFTASTRMVSFPLLAGSGERLRCRIPELPLVPGRYYLTLRAGIPGASLDRFERVAHIDVVPSDYYGSGNMPGPASGRFLIRQKWETMDNPQTENA